MIRYVTPPLLLSSLLLLLLLPVHAPASEPGPSVPGHVEERFAAFAKRWVENCQRNFTHNAGKREIRAEQGGVVVRYTAIDERSVAWRLKTTSSENSPYVGILTYHRTDLESRGKDRKEAEAKEFTVTRAVKVTEIFRYSNGSWQP